VARQWTEGAEQSWPSYFQKVTFVDFFRWWFEISAESFPFMAVFGLISDES
jgi:hypothetical protein